MLTDEPRKRTDAALFILFLGRHHHIMRAETVLASSIPLHGTNVQVLPDRPAEYQVRVVLPVKASVAFASTFTSKTMNEEREDALDEVEEGKIWPKPLDEKKRHPWWYPEGVNVSYFEMVCTR
jgi:hypothetical protein